MRKVEVLCKRGRERNEGGRGGAGVAACCLGDGTDIDHDRG